ncbi:glycosyltransferase family 4 protein [Candidatus Kaiserbacteria bacterium]|nr:glycosyltransferase family 4 protein [Candidatus Kaiserbacteria bacterium]
MKRILIFSLAYQPYVGGAELAIKEITDRLDPNEYSFDMITLRFDRKLRKIEKLGNVTVHRIGFTAEDVKVSDRALPLSCRLAKLLFPFTSLLKARALHREKRFDLVWAMMANQAGFGALFFKLLNPDVPFFLELQDGTPLARVKARRPVAMLLWPLYKAIYRKADVIKAISSFLKDLAREVGFHGRVEIIPNGVDIARFSAQIPEDEQAELKEKYGKKMGDIFLFTASRLVLSRGAEDIIRALAHLPGNVKLLIAGDGEDRGKLEKIARESKVAERVIFAGHVAHEDIPRLLKISDIFVRPSIIEGMGSAFVEAFAAGVPVIATPVGGIPDFLSDPDRDLDMEPTGLFCNVRDPESIAQAVKRYMNDPVLTTRIVKNARALAEEKYNWDLIAKDMRERVFSCLGELTFHR